MENVILATAKKYEWCMNCYESHHIGAHTKELRPDWIGDWCKTCSRHHRPDQHGPAPAMKSLPPAPTGDEYASWIEGEDEVMYSDVQAALARMGGGYRLHEPGRKDLPETSVTPDGTVHMSSAWKETPSGVTVDPSNPRGVGTDAPNEPRAHNPGDYL